jgi:hypothetical protein
MGNRQNEWAKRKLPELRREYGNRCNVRTCKHPRTNLEFAHVRQTELSRTGPRDRKEKIADIQKHPNSYRLLCHEHHTKLYADQHARLRKQGRR